MATITFDTQELVNKLKAAGFAPEQADAIVRAIADSHGTLVTKDYLDIRLGPIYTNLAVLKWMLGVLLAGVLALVLKAFF